MSSYTAPLSDLRFALHDVLKVEPLFARLGFTDATADVVDAVLEEAGRFSASVLAPLNSVGDEIGCVLDQATGEVTTPPGFKQAYDQFVDGGWTGLTASPELGGQGLPHTLGVPLNEMINAANLAWGNFPLLSHGAIEALKQHVQDFAASTDSRVEESAESAFGDVIHDLGSVHAGVARSDIVAARIAAQRLVAATVNVIAIRERTYFTSSRGAYVEQASTMRFAPAGLDTLCDDVLGSNDGPALAASVDALVTALSETLADHVGVGSATHAAVQPAALVNSYAEVREHCQKILSAAHDGDIRRAQSEAIGIQWDVATLLHRYAGNAELREWDRRDDVVDTYLNRGFPDVIGPAVKGDLEAVAHNARALEAKLHSLLRSEGVADNSFESVHELESALRGLREKRCC